MKIKNLLSGFLIFFVAFGTVQGQNKSDSKQQFTSLGDFTLENGQTIYDCNIGYRTFGKLNTDKSNAVIFLCGLGMNSGIIQQFVPGAIVDTSRFYLIAIDALGNGYSSSPSNSTKQPRLKFPQFTIRDMVETQYKVLTEKMGIHHLAAVAGFSLGGMQAFQWAVSHPEFMDKILSVVSTPQFSAYDLLWANTFIDAVKSDPAFKNGDYQGEPALPTAAHISQLVFSTPDYVCTHILHDSFPDWYKATGQQVSFDWNNEVRQLQAVITHDISKTTNGSLEDAAKIIKAKMFIVVCKQDHAVNPILPTKFAHMANAQLLSFDGDAGHTTMQMPFGAMLEFLNK